MSKCIEECKDDKSVYWEYRSEKGMHQRVVQCSAMQCSTVPHSGIAGLRSLRGRDSHIHHHHGTAQTAIPSPRKDPRRDNNKRFVRLQIMQVYRHPLHVALNIFQVARGQRKIYETPGNFSKFDEQLIFAIKLLVLCRVYNIY